MRAEPYWSRISSELEMHGFEAATNETWQRYVHDGVAVIVRPRLKISSESVWIEFGIGVRFDVVERVFSEAMNIPCLGEAATLGCDLRHLVDNLNDSGWTYAPGAEFFNAGLGEMITRLEEVGMATLLQYSTFDALHKLAMCRMNNHRQDRFIFREHHYIPVIFFLSGEYDLCSKYLEEKLVEFSANGLSASSPAVLTYGEFAKALIRKMVH